MQRLKGDSADRTVPNGEGVRACHARKIMTSLPCVCVRATPILADSAESHAGSAVQIKAGRPQTQRALFRSFLCAYAVEVVCTVTVGKSVN